MTTKAYLLIASSAFVVAVTGSDVIARISIAGAPLNAAFGKHFQWVANSLFGVVLLFAPFAAVSLICGAANKRAKSRGTVVLFTVAIAALSYFYFAGFQASQRAMAAERWTAAALSIGLLPFFIGLPLSGAVAIVAIVLARIDRRDAVTK